VGVSRQAAAAVTIRQFEPRDQHDARHVVLEGMREHWGKLDPTLNRDLADIETSYADGTFIVAECNSHVVATGAVVSRDGDCCEIVRMSTLRDFRRRGIASLVLSALLREARSRGYAHVRLATHADWHDAIAFYERAGLTRMHDERQPLEAFFELTL
jgi:GNAT superfamily N-acetyltransferase